MCECDLDYIFSFSYERAFEEVFTRAVDPFKCNDACLDAKAELFTFVEFCESVEECKALFYDINICCASDCSEATQEGYLTSDQALFCSGFGDFTCFDSCSDGSYSYTQASSEIELVCKCDSTNTALFGGSMSYSNSFDLLDGFCDSSSCADALTDLYMGQSFSFLYSYSYSAVKDLIADELGCSFQCYISSCGCPGSFLETWCDERYHTIEAQYCNEAESNCENSCGGAACYLYKSGSEDDDDAPSEDDDASSGECYISQCGCPESYAESWCSEENAKISDDWCAASESNCMNCNGQYCT